MPSDGRTPVEADLERLDRAEGDELAKELLEQWPAIRAEIVTSRRMLGRTAPSQRAIKASAKRAAKKRQLSADRLVANQAKEQAQAKESF